MIIKKEYLRKFKHYIKNRKIKINTFIIGVQKGGTSSLFYHLIKHPECNGGKKKEIHYFDTPRYKLGHTWYHSNFPKNNKVLIDASPSYIYVPKVPERIFHYNPEAHFIVVLRDPIDRAFSAWNMYKYFYKIRRNKMLDKTYTNKNNKIAEYFYSGKFPSFEEAIEMELKWIEKGKEIAEPSLLRRGFYYEQILKWLQIFPRKQFFFIINENFKIKKGETLNNLTKFLKISSYHWGEEILENSFTGEYEEKINPQIREKLKIIFYNKNKFLPELINEAPNWYIYY